ncbi:Transcriptional regulator [Carbonactinospora thermoautotrophica]|uniref:Transcriptional regulator n=2 Tax=Carbonactinospora thermoautotrophica TaxID=1469144 RepID=A0A132MMM2_9ACTN|nr:Transcriptional regulator [Carbonactinospora thermoautotrophica]
MRRMLTIPYVFSTLQSVCAAERNNREGSTVARVAALLGAFGVDDVALGVSELARRTGLPKSTVFRLVDSLTAHGLLARTGKRVRLGLRLFELGQLVPIQRGLREAALPFMTDLQEATRQVVHLAVLEGTEVVYLEILRSKDGPALPSRVGGRLPAHATGVGKAILAFSPPDVVEAVIAHGLTRVSRRTIVVPALLRRELETIRKEGVAFDREESGDGIVCAASPIFGSDDTVVGGLSISGWSNRMNLDRMAPAVRTAALALSRTLHAPRLT